MLYKLSFLTLIILAFNSCGTVETSPNKAVENSSHSRISNPPSSNQQTIVTCQQNKNITALYTEYQKKEIKIDAPSGLKLLLLNQPNNLSQKTFNKNSLYNLFKTEYFWAKQTPKNLNLNSYSEPQALINDAKYKDDRWSFAVTPEVYSNVSSQKSIGIGFSCQDTSEGCLVTFVRIDSPADKMDLRRGDIIQRVNNRRATQKGIYTKGQEEKLLTFNLLRANRQCSGKVLPKEYSYKVVASKTIKTSQNEKVGYLRLDSFLGDDKILAQIDDAFDNFKKESIEKLVIDLRYNGGGSVDLASKLLDKLVQNKENQEQFTLAWNQENKSKNKLYLFDKTSNSLDLKQILFLTTKDSASASELIISAMMPYLPEEDVVIIGEKTHGKPVGMSGKSDGNYYYFLINFVVKNSLGFYDYFEGLRVSSGCNIKDDPFHEMGDKNEALLKSALHYIDTGSCK